MANAECAGMAEQVRPGWRTMANAANPPAGVKRNLAAAYGKCTDRLPR